MVEPITIIIPHLPERAWMLERALASVRAQTLQPAAVLVEKDPLRTGIAATRNRLLDRVRTPWVACLDDDDELLPHHLETLAKELDASGADLAWSEQEMVGADYEPSFIEVTHLSKLSAVLGVGGFPEPFSEEWPHRWEDYGLLAKLLKAGAVFRKVNQVTWRQHIHDSNTVGTSFTPEQPQPITEENHE